MTTKFSGFIIGKKDLREADRLFSIYTKEAGKVTAMAQGSKKLSSKLSGNLELMHHAVFTIAKGKQIDRIATVDVLDTYEPIKNNLDSLTIALYALDLCDRAVKPGIVDEGLYELLSDVLVLCAEAKGRYADIAHFFMIKLASLLGYQPAVKGFEKSIAQLIAEKPPAHLERSARACLASLLERPAPSQVFFDFLSQSAVTQKSRAIP
ncbi:DNA repair protein RecO [Candidatus Uhrbacteria bacterium]|nr:DNA repair protein RecO [Candidatus Uhrbacteria bacterium]